MDKFHRRSIRLKGYDYSQNRHYFVTICAQNREEIFSHIHRNKIVLSEIGKMIELWWKALPHHFPECQIDIYQIMPNHIHGILIIVGADQCVCPNKLGINNIKGEYIGSPLHHMMQWFKTMTTNEYIRNVELKNWSRFNKRLWQRNYYEHIIRNERDYWAVKQHIQDNPKNWEKDELNRN